MSATFNAFEYLAYIIPGAVLLYAVLWLSPALKAPLVEEKKIDLGSFGIFVILAFVAGLLVQAVAHYVPDRWVMRPLGLVHRTDALICGQDEIKKAIGGKLKQDMDTTCGSENSRQAVLRRIFADEQLAGAYHNRVELFEGRYYLGLGLAAALIALIPISIILRPEKRLIIVPVLVIAAILSMERTSYFDRIYARELIQSFLAGQP